MNRRWKILGTLTTRSPLHIGSGAITQHPRLIVENESDGEAGGTNGTAETRCDVQAIVRDSRRRADGTIRGWPCVPGTALKGVLRSWGERFFTTPDARRMLSRIFGHRDVQAQDSESGWAEFTTALVGRQPDDLGPYAAHVPYWREDRLTGILSHVAIEGGTGVAERNKLYFEEFVPEGISFSVEIFATRLDADEIELLLAILEQGACHATHPYQFGANGADGWGRMTWRKDGVFACTEPPRRVTVAGGGIYQTPYIGPREVKTFAPDSPPPHVALELTLDFSGPLLVDDKSRAKERDYSDGGTTYTNFTRMRRVSGDTWLPASSFRGVVRARAEFLLRSLRLAAQANMNGVSTASNPPPDMSPVERLFGNTSRRSRLQIEEFVEDANSPRRRQSRRQDFVAIDRFLGGAADGAKFDATYADRPRLTTRIVLDLEGLDPGDVALAAAALRDVCEARTTFGFGGSKGFGVARGTVRLLGLSGLDPTWGVPDSLRRGDLDDVAAQWLSARLAEFRPTPARAAPFVAFAVPVPVVPTQGKLSWRDTKKGKQRVLEWLKKGNNWTKTPTEISDESRLSASLLKSQESVIEVDLEFDAKQQPIRIRPRGEAWVTEAASVRYQGRFAHPYYFARLVSRVGAEFQGELGDRPPTGLDRFQPGFYSGRMRVRLTTKTPLLICDDETVREVNGHKTFDMRLQDGKPLLASSSVRGMLRAAYEAATNSRLGVFPGNLAAAGRPAKAHGRRLGFRVAAQESLHRVPVRIVEVDGRLHAELLPGTTPISAGRQTGGDAPPVYAAWCASYGADWRPRGGGSRQHGAKVWAYLTPWTYNREGQRPTVFHFWNVEEIRTERPDPAEMDPVNRRRQKFGHASPADWGQATWFEGYLCVTGRNINRKHDERFFFAENRLEPVPLSDENVQQWRELIQDYQDQHREDILAGERCPPILRSASGKGTAEQPFSYSRHVAHLPGAVNVEASQLRPGDLAHAEVKPSGDGWQVVGLYPVMISRKLYEKGPLELLPADLRPATNARQLSPADRVFGWVNQEQSALAADAPAQRSAVRIGPVECHTDDAVHSLGSPQPLAILGQPKPHQGRFYLGDKEGRARDGRPKKEMAGYSTGNRIRGPKVYPHHRQFREETWFGWEGSNQNRSITGWVRPGVSFEFDLDLVNLSRFELSALLWLLSLPDEHFLRLGLGKPLGFGSVRVELVADCTCVADGADWINSLVSWTFRPSGLSPQQREGLVAEFTHVMSKANAELLPSLLKVARGFDHLPIQYPTLENQENPNEHFEWFAENERENRRQPLPDLAKSDISLS